MGYLVEEKIDKDFTGYGTHTKERHFPKGNDDGTDVVKTRIYKGEYKNGKEHGIGMYSWSTGPKCVGEFVDDKVTGVAIKKWNGKLDVTKQVVRLKKEHYVFADEIASDLMQDKP